MGILATALGVCAGSLVGLVSGYVGGLFDMVAQRLVDAVMAFPTLVVALVMVLMFGPSVRNLIMVVGIAIAPNVSRVVRGSTLAEQEAVYVQAARSMGAGPVRVMLRHILPNLVAPITVVTSSILGGVILVEAGLSFLGFGTPPPTPYAPWMAIFPGLAVSLVVLAFNLVGDSVRDRLDPRLRE